MNVKRYQLGVQLGREAFEYEIHAYPGDCLTPLVVTSQEFVLAKDHDAAIAERDRRIAELERALRAISDEAREGYYDGPGLQRFVEIRGLAEDALAPVGGASDVEEGE